MINILWLALCYLFGSVPFGLVVANVFCNVDPRTGGSGNIGATNVARLCGAGWGVLVLVLDICKGFLPAVLAGYMSDSWVFLSLTALACILGHVYPVFINFKGGKAVATTVGVYLGLAAWPLIIAAALTLTVIYLSGFVSLGSLTLVTVMPVLLLLSGNWGLLPVSIVILFIIYNRHGENILRLARGEEHPWKKSKA